MESGNFIFKSIAILTDAFEHLSHSIRRLAEEFNEHNNIEREKLKRAKVRDDLAQGDDNGRS